MVNFKLFVFYHNKAKTKWKQTKDNIISFYSFGKGNGVFWPQWNFSLPPPKANSASYNLSHLTQWPRMTSELLSLERMVSAWWEPHSKGVGDKSSGKAIQVLTGALESSTYRRLVTWCLWGSEIEHLLPWELQLPLAPEARCLRVPWAQSPSWQGVYLLIRQKRSLFIHRLQAAGPNIQRGCWVQRLTFPSSLLGAPPPFTYSQPAKRTRHHNLAGGAIQEVVCLQKWLWSETRLLTPKSLLTGQVALWTTEAETPPHLPNEINGKSSG